MDKTKLLMALAAVMTAVLIVLICIAVLLPGSDGPINAETPSTGAVSSPTDGSSVPSDPPQTDPPVTEPPVTEPPATEPPETEVPTVGPTEFKPDGNELIGALYTRDQLAAIDGTRLGYGAGPSTNGSRPPYATNAQNAVGSLYNAYFLAPDNGKVYFTFSHGYEQDNLTGIVLDVLKEKGVKGVFFINRGYARTAPHMVWRMINEGHIVANHATNHPDMGTLTVDEMVAEIMVMHNYMVENFGYKMTLFRPPSGYYSARLLAVAQSLGYTTVEWSYTARDWDRSKPLDPAKFLTDVVDSAHSGAIYQFHTVTANGVSIIGDAIDAIRAKGYEFDLFTGKFE